MNRACAIVLTALLAGGSAAAELPRFSTPQSADEVLRAKELPFRLRYQADQWQLTPQRSNFRLLARVVHKKSDITGAFVYREEPASDEAVRKRARKELKDAFANYEVLGFGERVVNGAPVLFLKARATDAAGSEVAVRSYYWVGPDGVVDYSLVARRPVFEAHRQAIMNLLNGLEIASAE